MNTVFFKTIPLLLLVFVTTHATAQNLKLLNGSWFNGERFEKKDIMYVNEGFFSNEAPQAALDTTLDFTGKYLLPPFVEAHTHNLSSSYGLQGILQAYLEEGTFYVQVLGCSQKARTEVVKVMYYSYVMFLMFCI